jgi:hypothetical protein
VSIYLDARTDAAACLYDVLVRPMQRPKVATPVESRKYTQGKPCKPCDGVAGWVGREKCKGTGFAEVRRLYAGQREVDETPDDFRDRILGDIADHPDEYFARFEVVRLEEEMERHRDDLWKTALDMSRHHGWGHAPRNPDGCRAYSRDCEFLALCSGAAPADDQRLFTRVENPHVELSMAEDA